MLTFRGRAGGERSDAHVVIQREFVAAEHIGPRVAVSFHAAFASLSDALAESATRIDGPVETHGTVVVVDKSGVRVECISIEKRERHEIIIPEERAEEELRVGVAADVEEWDPRGRLLDDFGHRVVIQEIG